MTLSAYQQWMVQSNLARIDNGEASAETTVALLRANGYPSIAAEVATACALSEDDASEDHAS